MGGIISTGDNRSLSLLVSLLWHYQDKGFKVSCNILVRMNVRTSHSEFSGIHWSGAIGFCLDLFVFGILDGIE